MAMEVVEHDFRVGGQWKYTMKMPNGQPFEAFGTYQAIEAPTRLETTANFLPMTEGVTLVVTLTDQGDQTDFKFEVIHPTEAYKKQQEDMGALNGWGGVFQQLADYLPTMAG